MSIPLELWAAGADGVRMVNRDPGSVLAMLTVVATPHPVEYCFQKAAKDFGHYFYPEDLNGTLTCVNNCTQETKSRLNCNRGYCQLLRAGPQCV